jgi:hypothetical protein
VTATHLEYSHAGTPFHSGGRIPQIVETNQQTVAKRLSDPFDRAPFQTLTPARYIMIQNETASTAQTLDLPPVDSPSDAQLGKEIAE